MRNTTILFRLSIATLSLCSVVFGDSISRQSIMYFAQNEQDSTMANTNNSAPPPSRRK
ncbi:hypothetical protein ACWIWK_02570 [Helicobacter sp. 23-1048]